MVQRGLSRFRPTKVILVIIFEHNRLRSKDLNVVAGLSVPMDYDCVYDSV